MPATIKFNLMLKCDLCGIELRSTVKGDGFLIAPCGPCRLKDREVAWDAGFDAGFDVGRSKAVDPNVRA